MQLSLYSHFHYYLLFNSLKRLRLSIYNISYASQCPLERTFALHGGEG